MKKRPRIFLLSNQPSNHKLANPNLWQKALVGLKPSSPLEVTQVPANTLLLKLSWASLPRRLTISGISSGNSLIRPFRQTPPRNREFGANVSGPSQRLILNGVHLIASGGQERMSFVFGYLLGHVFKPCSDRAFILPLEVLKYQCISNTSAQYGVNHANDTKWGVYF